MLARLFALIASLLPLAALAQSAPPPVILISIDGFRPDYLDRGVTPMLSGLAATGVRAAMRPSFPSKTFPNHYTLVTGLRPDAHGIVDNTIEDPALGRFELSRFDAVSDGRWWAQAEPIWATAERAGVKTATVFWPGSEARIRDTRPGRWAHYDAALPPERTVGIALDWLDLPPKDRPRFVTLYFEEVDSAGHRHGPDSPEVDAALAQVDAAVAQLAGGLAARGIAADLIVVADHGMTATAPTQALFVEDWVALDRVRLIGDGANAGLVPADADAERALLSPHAHARCVRKGDLPATLHYGRNPRVPPVLCMADPGWFVTTRERLAKRDYPPRGEHGYDPALPDMAAVFIANGPSFRRGAVLATFDNVHVHALLTRLLGLTPPPQVDARLAPVAGALREGEQRVAPGR